MVRFTRILCPIDFSDISARALTYAVALATSYDAQLAVLHVAAALEDGEAPRNDVHLGDPRRLQSREEMIAAIRRMLHEAGAGGLGAEALAEEGRAHEVIVQRALAQPADLLVMGTHGRSGFSRLLLGSVTEKVLRTAPCPVLTVPPAAPATPPAAVAFKRILCALDYSPSAIKALHYGLELGRLANGCVTVLYALEYMDPEEPCEHVDFDIRAHRQHFIDHARARLDAQLAHESTMGGEIRATIAIDRAYKAILRHASESMSDLIVMGAQGTGGLELMVYGSNTQHVVRAATCPVLTLHA